MTVEDRLRRAMTDHAAAVPPPADRWAEIEAAAAHQLAEARQRSRRRIRGMGLVGLATAAAAALIALPALTRQSGHRVTVSPGSRPTIPATPLPGPGTTTTHQPQPTTASRQASPTSATTTAPATGKGGFAYQPLFPFRTLGEANAWRASHQATGAQPWHLDPGQTALSFTMFLGYSDITNVFNVSHDTTGAHATVGFFDPNGDPIVAAVIHLRRFGTDADAPWEVVGTDDSASFTLTTPRYGATVASPVTVGGAITGVDESIRVEVFQASSTAPLWVSCCHPAGGAGQPWTATVSYQGATDDVLVVAASTGGHLVAVERFAVTGVRTTPGTTPGL